MNSMNDYEKGELAAITKWKKEEPNIVSKAIGVVLQPLVWAAEKAIPHAAIEGALVASNAAAECGVTTFCFPALFWRR